MHWGRNFMLENRQGIGLHSEKHIPVENGKMGMKINIQ